MQVLCMCLSRSLLGIYTMYIYIYSTCINIYSLLLRYVRCTSYSCGADILCCPCRTCTGGSRHYLHRRGTTRAPMEAFFGASPQRQRDGPIRPSPAMVQETRAAARGVAAPLSNFVRDTYNEPTEGLYFVNKHMRGEVARTVDSSKDALLQALQNMREASMESAPVSSSHILSTDAARSLDGAVACAERALELSHELHQLRDAREASKRPSFETIIQSSTASSKSNGGDADASAVEGLLDITGGAAASASSQHAEESGFRDWYKDMFDH